MPERVGIYICECGPNIREAIDIDELVTFAKNLEHVSFVKPFNLLCADNGKELITSDIKAYHLTRIVIAGCSPKEHERTFQKVLENAGMNPYFLQIANIREQCAWVVKNRSFATQKAKALVAGAVKRVVFHEPLEIREVECNPNVLVVGAGVTGLSSARALAQKNRRVYLVEKSPCIGGKAALYEEVFPTMECASCMLDPLFDEILHNDRIEVSLMSEVEEILGSFGNFIIKVTRKPRFVDMKTCIGCGECMNVCPVKVKNEFNEGLNERRAIHIAYPGALPHVAFIDREHCLHFQGGDCNACEKACPFGSIDLGETDQRIELNVGAIVLATGFDLFDTRRAVQYRYGKIDNIYTSLEFERILNSSGPTGGEIVLKNGIPPQKIALIHCVGSRTQSFHEYCSGVCCAYLLKFAHLIMKKMPEVKIIEFFSDFCLPGKNSQKFLFKIAEGKGISFYRIKNPDSIRIRKNKGRITIVFFDANGKSRSITTDMVVLAPAIEGARDAQKVAEVFGITQDGDGFFVEEHASLASVSTTTKGICIAGCAQGPKDIQSSVAQGKAAAGVLLSLLIPGERLQLEAMNALVFEDLCSGCKMCIGLCPYKAITYDDKKEHSVINDILCVGCGICVAACPSGAIKARHFTDEQIYEEIQGTVND